MRNADVKIGHVYLANVSGRLCPVRVLRQTVVRGLRHDRTAWYAENLHTGRVILIRSPQRLRQASPEVLQFYLKGVMP